MKRRLILWNKKKEAKVEEKTGTKEVKEAAPKTEEKK